MFGLLYASGVFIALIDDPSFTLSIGVAGFFTAVGITLAGILMTRVIPPAHAVSAPTYIAAAGSLGLLCQVFMPYALAQHKPALLFVAAVALGLGGGCIYVASVDVLQAWVPEAPGLVTGVGMLCGGAGSLLGIPFYITLVRVMKGPLPAVGVAGALAGVVALAASTFVRRPPTDWAPDGMDSPRTAPITAEDLREEELRVEHELAWLLPPSAPRLRPLWPELKVKDILTDKGFFMLLIAFAAAVGPGFGFVLAFQEMVHRLFGVSVGQANTLFFWVTLTGVAGRLVSGVAVDTLQSHESASDDALYGAKRANIMLLVAQTVALGSIPISIHNGYVTSFTVASAVVYMTFSGGPVVAACMVRGIFMPNNASLAFSLVAISIGCGDVFFSWIVAWCAQSSRGDDGYSLMPERHTEDYNLFLFFGLLWTICGLVASLYIQVSPKVGNHDLKGASLASV